MNTQPWWQQAVFYEIYPRSFADGNGDGIGDFLGLTARLDYLHDLGIDAIWLAPHYPSPFLDCGYDIANYTDVAPEYGSLHDFTAFLLAAHARGIRVVLDLVLNHTSDQHPWFIESRASLDNPKRDWYIWRDGRDGGPPSNWASIFGGPAWTLDPQTNQYYYHAFLKEQPDLNWRNPDLKAAMWEVVRFWLDLGVDGFRLDAIATIFEHPDLPNHTLPLAAHDILDANALDEPTYRQLLRWQLKQPGLHELLQELRTLVDSYPGDRVLVGEDEDLAFHGAANDELHLVFNFPLMRADRLTPQHISANQIERLAQLPAGAWPCNTLGNHDSPRAASSYGDGVHDAQLARLHIALLLTLQGTPFLYNGEEIGMTNLELARLDELRDTAAIHQYHKLVDTHGLPPQEALQATLASTRDRCRSPMQWSDATNAGFCPPGVAPWLPVHPNHKAGVSVAAQVDDPASLLSFYRRLLHLRRTTPALLAGEYRALPAAGDAVLAFLRFDPSSRQTCLVALNFAEDSQTLAVDLDGRQIRTLFTSQARENELIVTDSLTMTPFEVLIGELREQ